MAAARKGISEFLKATIILISLVFLSPQVVFAESGIKHIQGIIPTRVVWRLATENLSLGGDEKLGMAAGNLLFDVGENLRLGIGSYGAIRGERGGFITIGFAGEIQQPLGHSLLSQFGLFVGAGGGHGGYTLAGGGLMLRGNVGLTYETSIYGNIGVGVSYVRFPSGSIASTQPYIQYEHSFNTFLNPGWVNFLSDTGSPNMRPVKARAKEIAAVARHYSIQSFSLQDGRQSSTMNLVGIEWLTYPSERWFILLQSDGAMGGESKGYMQIMAGGGYRLPLLDDMAMKLTAAAGPAGGGGVDTGGGLLFDAGFALQRNVSRRTAIELSFSKVRAPSGEFGAQSVAAKLSYRFDTPVVLANEVSLCALRSFYPEWLRMRVTNQTYFKADDRWRNQYIDSSVNNLGVQLDYFFTPTWFLTGQGLAAYAGEAGAYMTGQLGVGRRWSYTGSWFAESEGLLGAAGGGGLEVGGGLVAQANATLGYQVDNALSVMATAGRIQAMHGNFKANVIGVSLAYQFTAFAR